VRIAVVTQPYYPQAGGVSEHVHHTTVELRRLGHDVDVVTARYPSARASGEGVYRIGRNVLVPHLGAFANVAVGRGLGDELERLFAARDYDVVHVHEPLSPTLPLLAIRRARPRTLVVGTFHASARRGIAYRAAHRWLRPYSERIDVRIAVSQAARRFASRYFDDDYTVIPNGIDPARFHPRNAPLPGLGPRRPTILFVARFYPRKGFRVLLRALPRVAERVPDARVLVVGGGPLEPWYRALAARTPLEVHFLGELSPEDIPRAYRSGDVFVAPSTGQESFGIVHLEAMASGIPIVASDIEGYREILDQGREALLFPNRDVEALADAIVQTLRDPDRAAAMRSAGRAKALRYGWAGIAQRLEALYLERLGVPAAERAVALAS
jgi:phosphatidylinositol alpha-mannosyltransferase